MSNESKSKVVFSLRDIIDALESMSDEARWFANAETGEVDCRFGSFFRDFSDEEDEDRFEGAEWIGLPEHDGREDWRVMRDFAWELGGPLGAELLDDIQGRGAFRAFRSTVERNGALQSWYAYKDERMGQRAIEWLEDHGLAWKDDRHENSKRDWRELLPDNLKMKLELSLLEGSFSVCQCEHVDAALLDSAFCSVTKANDELSVVCRTEDAPADATAREDGWRALKVRGPLDFGLVGILAKISSALAEAEVPLFAISTYDTDYVLVKDDRLEDAVEALRFAGCRVER